MTLDLTPSQNYSQDQSDAQAVDFAIDKRQLNINTLILAEVQIVNADGTLTVKSLLNYKSASNQPIDPPVLFEVPQGVIQGGSAGIIIEYQVGDQVLVGFIQRDISTLKATRQQSTPQLNHMHSIMDGFIICCWPQSAPTVFIKVTNSGVQITAPSITLGYNAQQLLTTQSVIHDSQGKPCTYVSGATNITRAG